MFGRKKKDKDSIAIGMNESYVDNSDIPDDIIQSYKHQPQQSQNQVQPMQQNQPMYYPNQVNTMQPQYYPPQTQPVQQQPVQKPRTAIIVKTELQDNGEFVNTVITNYQLNIGYARLDQ